MICSVLGNSDGVGSAVIPYNAPRDLYDPETEVELYSIIASSWEDVMNVYYEIEGYTEIA